MTKYPAPITVFCRDAEQANLFAVTDEADARALTTPRGTLAFHALIAEHGAGVFQTLYVPVAMRSQFKTPAGGIVKFAEGVNDVQN